MYLADRNNDSKQGVKMSKTKGINRRSFIKQSTLGLIGGGIMGKAGNSHTQEEIRTASPRIKEYRTLGRTGFKVSDLGMGHVGDEGLLRTFLDAGVNYIDTSEGYRYNERVLGKAMKNLDRKSLFITSKVIADTSYKHISQSNITKEGFLKRAYRILESLRTDYLDCLMISTCETIEMLKNEGFHAATEQLKKEGRLRFIGVSNHGSQFWPRASQEPMEKIFLAAAEDGRFDVVLMAYNFLKDDRSERVLEVCSQKNIGTTLMKVNPIRSYNEMKAWLEKNLFSKSQDEREEVIKRSAEEGVALKDVERRMTIKVENAQEFIKRRNLKSDKEIRDAAVRFVLSNPNVNTVCYTLQNYSEAQEFLKLSGSRLNSRDKELLTSYSRECGNLYCRHACGLCEPACPHQVPVNTIMRYDHYFVAQGREKHAMAEYASLESQKADRCQDCAGYCESACPYGVPVRALLATAHNTLTLV
jgi:predicted aldo/keto reductase-like oxidoreductase